MATNIINDLDSQLASLNQLKPPGASKGKISSITQLCVTNIQAESNIVQSLYRALKKAPSTHKLGAIYVIDSVVRRWIEQAKQNGQDLNIEGRGEPGTFPAAVKRVTELMPALFDDIMKGIPAEQKDKLSSMIKIWDKGNTFPAKMLADFQARLSGETNQTAMKVNGSAGAQGTGKHGAGDKFSAPLPTRPLNTPIGYPPQYLRDQGLIPPKKADTSQTNGTATTKPQPAQIQQTPQPQAAAPAPTQDVNSILAALANIPKPAAPPAQQAPAPQAAAPQQGAQPQLPPNFAALFGQQNGTASAPPPFQQPQIPAYPTPQAPPPFQMPPSFSGYPPQPPPSIPPQYSQALPPPPQQQADPLGALRNILPQNILSDQQKLVQALKLLQDLQNDGIPMEQWGPVIEAFNSQYQPPAPTGYGQYGQDRGRSRSPERGGVRRRASPVYGTYEEIQSRGQFGDDRGDHGGARGRYRQRSPIRDSPVPVHMDNRAMNGNPMQPKYIAIDNNLPHDNIKVLSRTLFVGGANGQQQDIHALFERFGRVQTCIANRDKRHAFVKMTTRAHALNARAGMERLQAQNDREVMNIARQTKWGVGFGPRECCDYQKGESIIPIHKLTDADMKWLLTAEYGGTGGQKVEGGMVLEEPDIEIGAGVSSKAMSKRVLPEGVGQQQQHGFASGGKRQHRDDGGGQQRKERKRNNDGGAGGSGGGYGGGYGGQQVQQQLPMEAYGYARPEPVAVATPPAVPGFGGFALPGAGQGGYR
ncbi:hypothetical protein LTR37_004145 [Vermiconidia calcicola]|uniref:Uncharacterized protein n=1 Tax=Vermiconidia calcicola TaxID=1690605 RepID=A0ACC3NMV5_9PEZI|nr:hypothetical protein LTR37_004145 [Vermiconidia calcicola]